VTGGGTGTFALINEACERPGPVGKRPDRFRPDAVGFLGEPAGDRSSPPLHPAVCHVVGILANPKNARLAKSALRLGLYSLHRDAPTGRTARGEDSGESRLLLNAVRQQVRTIDKDHPLSRPITLEEVLGFRNGAPRFTWRSSGFFGSWRLVAGHRWDFQRASQTSVASSTHEIGAGCAKARNESRPRADAPVWAGRRVLMDLGTGLLGIALAQTPPSEVFQSAL